jgi:hypothetical protein
MLETSIERVGQIDSAESNADAVCTRPPVTVGSNVHLTAGKQIFTKPMIGR